MRERLNLGGSRLAVAALALSLSGCISLAAPEKPIEINLNVKIEQEVLVKLERDVEQLMRQNPQDFPAPKTPRTQQ